MDTNARLMRLAAIARTDERGLKQALKTLCPDWVPSSGSPGVPNLEYTRTRDPGWRAVSVTVRRILTNCDVSPADIEGLAILFEPTEPKGDVPDVTLQMLIDHAQCSRTKILNAIDGQELTRERNGKADWYVYSELRPFLPQGTTWPVSVERLKKKTAKDSK